MKKFSVYYNPSQILLDSHNLEALMEHEECKKNLSILRCSTSMFRPEIKDGVNSFMPSRIPGAIYFSLYEFSNYINTGWYMLPEKRQFIKQMKMIDVRINDTIVCYDFENMVAASRTAQMLRVFGAKQVHVLDGGSKKWVQEDRIIDFDTKNMDPNNNNISRRIEKREDKPQKGAFNYKLNKKMINNL